MNDFIGPYHILSEAGNGSYGTVYLVENSLSGQTVALKVLHGKSEKRELEGLIRYRECRHPNLLQIHHIDRLPDGRLYYTMDAAHNRAPDGYEPDTLATHGKVPPKTLVPVISALLDGIEELHHHQLIHRDIKPENILFVNGKPVLGDIGLTAHSGHSSLVGTPCFMPPDVITGQRSPDEASDLFALGRVAYVALTGMEPFNYPSVPADLSADAASVLAFCRAASSPDATTASCRKALEPHSPQTHGHHRRLRLVFAVALAIVCLIVALFMSTSHEASESDKSHAANLSHEEFQTRLASLYKQYPISEEIATQAKARYDELRKEDSTLSDEIREHLSDILEEKHRLFSKTDPLYRFGELTIRIQENIQKGTQTPTMEILNLIQQDLAESYSQLPFLARVMSGLPH
ncbi:MAG: protein kinase [Victivallales bacterium]|nr:protein kinase [Victivallales bacterium]